MFIIELLRVPYADQEATVRTGHGATEYFLKNNQMSFLTD